MRGWDGVTIASRVCWIALWEDVVGGMDRHDGDRQKQDCGQQVDGWVGAV